MSLRSIKKDVCALLVKSGGVGSIQLKRNILLDMKMMMNIWKWLLKTYKMINGHYLWNIGKVKNQRLL
ncbi:hypothetical protein Sjap_018775 [Stephania japonica]|uniref:Uncharacterized protein n=1 Tax=Stephania japonica TaxID=461633 RepID=A0AAP0I8R2_9MAGN